ncbi:MAG: hypothetical protein IJT94_18700 [Oscillibacter sp.]|nr:hypothetical protein [Oscillibacter sp.]
MGNRQFWIDAGIRAVRTMAQTAVGVTGTATVMSDVDWKMTLSSVLLAGLTSLLMSLDRLGNSPPLAQTAKEGS